MPDVPDRSGDTNRVYEPSLEDEIRRRIPTDGFRGTQEALNRLYPSAPANPHLGAGDTTGIETSSNGENPGGLREQLNNSGSGQSTHKPWPAEQKAKWAKRPRVYRAN